MNLDSFSGDVFDHMVWINDIFKDPDAVNNEEQFAASLTTQLQLLISKLNISLEEESDRVTENLPCIIREATALHEEVNLVRSNISSISFQIKQTNSDTESSMKSLIEMDLLKNRISALSKALEEAGNWSLLVTDLEDAFGAADLRLAADKMVGMQNSLKMLRHVPDYEDRLEMLFDSRNRLESLSRPELMTAFSLSKVQEGSYLYAVFKSIDKVPQMINYYVEIHLNQILEKWVALVESGNNVIEWIAAILDHNLLLCKKQLVWFREVFVDEKEAAELHLIHLLSSANQNFDPKIQFCIDAGIKLMTPYDTLACIIEIKHSFYVHAEAINSLLNSSAELNDDILTFLKDLYAPLRFYIKNYSDLEFRCCGGEMIELTNASKDTIDELRGITLSVPRFIQLLKDTMNRCISFTQGVAIRGVIETFNRLTENYTDRFKRIGRILTKRKATNTQNILQQSLTLNQTAGLLLFRLEETESIFAAMFMEAIKSFIRPNIKSSPLTQAHLYLLSEEEARSDLVSFYSLIKNSISKSSCIILEGSRKTISEMCSDLQSSAFEIMFHSINQELDGLHRLPIWASASAGSKSRDEICNLPEYCMSPQEYITHIGQHLMILPQILEPYLASSSGLSKALDEKVFPFMESSSDEEESLTDMILNCIARATCYGYEIQLLQIEKLSMNSSSQLMYDISYLRDILADLGCMLSKNLETILVLLGMSTSDLMNCDTSQEYPKRIVDAIYKMRTSK